MPIPYSNQAPPKKLHQLLNLLGILFFVSVLPGCLFSYLVKSAYNQAKLLNNRVPIEDVIKDPKTSEETRKKLQLAIYAREFAETKLGLKPSKNYTSYVKLKGPYVTYIVRAAPTFELKAHLWSFPFVGKLPYKGFFSKEEAQEEAKDFPKDQYDTYIRGVSAYSTLGWFDDPLLSSMLRYSDHNLVNTIIHETVHATLFIKGHADFNERLATFLGNKGTEEYYKVKEGPTSPTLLQIQKENKDDKVFSKFITQELEDLKNWYDESKGHLTVAQKEQRLVEIQTRFSTLIKPQLQTDNYDRFASSALNNAYLLSYKTYMADLSDFETVFQQFGGNFSTMLKFCQSLEKQKDPEKSLKEEARRTQSSDS